MDQESLVIEQRESGERLIQALRSQGFEVRVAFWMKPIEAGKWILCVASPFVDEQGKAVAYRFVHSVLKTNADLWIEPLDIRVIGMRDSLTTAALAIKEPVIPNSPFAMRNARSYPGATWFGGATLAGTEIDGAYIYPLPLSTV
jgi:hypothetical protein